MNDVKIIEATKAQTLGNWRGWLRSHTTYFFAGIATAPEIWINSPQFQALLPLNVVSHVAPLIGVLGFLLRIRRQLDKTEKTP